MRILFITSSRIGDAVISSGILQALRERHPGARLTVACGAAAAGVFVHLPGLERLIVFEKEKFDAHWVKLWARLVGQVWDLAVDVRGSGVSLFLLARRRVILRGGRRPGRRYEQLGEGMGMAPAPLPVVWTDAADAARAASVLALTEAGPVIGLGPTANWSGKVWPPERFVALFEGLQVRLPGARAAVFAGPGAAEARLAAPVLAALPGAIDLVGKLSLTEVAACMGRLALFVGNDSGLMHIAAAAGAPALGLFGMSRADEYAPAGSRAAFVAAPGPAGAAAMGGLTVEAVLLAAEKTAVKIAQVMAGAAHGGAELFFERMTVALAGAGQEVLPVIRADVGRAARLRAAGLAPVEFRFGGNLDFRTTGRVRRALRDFRPALAIAWMSRAAQHLPAGDWVNAGRLGGYYDLKYFRSCRHLAGNTRGIVDWIAAQGWPQERVHYLPNFVTDFAETRAVTRASLGVPEGAPLLLGLGRLHAVKGFDILVRVMKHLPYAYLILAGEGPERARLESLIAALGVGARCRLLGWREDAGALLKAADLFVSSSRHEPLGNMVLEAFSAGCPVLAARAQGPAEVIRDGVDGVLVAVNDAAALADAALLLLADGGLRNALAAAGRLRFEREFAEAQVVRAWLDFCTRVAG